MMSYSTSPNQQQGFSLIEIAVGLVIISLVVGSFITPISSLIDNARRTEADKMLDDIHDAMMGFAINNNGRLPCPATTSSNGAEAMAGSNCSQEHGFVPGVSLGLHGSYGDNNLLNDPWGNPYRYSFNPSAGYQVCTQSACPNAASILSANIAAVIISTGADLSTSADQSENTDNDGHFVRQNFRDAGANAFDDHIRWVSPNVLTLYLTR